MKLNPTIDQYLLSTCLFIIDEFNDMYSLTDNMELKRIADEEYNEMDICVRIGYPFRNMVHYTVGDGKNRKIKDENEEQIKNKINHDLYVKSKDFKIEVKYLKNWSSERGNKSASKNWKEYQQDFDWLHNEIKQGNKGKCAFVIGWFNCVDKFSTLMQLGCTPGGKPKYDPYKATYFPFLKTLGAVYTQDLEYLYSKAYKSVSIDLAEEMEEEYNCLFLGNEQDRFHFAIYY